MEHGRVQPVNESEAWTENGRMKSARVGVRRSSLREGGSGLVSSAGTEWLIPFCKRTLNIDGKCHKLKVFAESARHLQLLLVSYTSIILPYVAYVPTHLMRLSLIHI